MYEITYSIAANYEVYQVNKIYHLKQSTTALNDVLQKKNDFKLIIIQMSTQEASCLLANWLLPYAGPADDAEFYVFFSAAISK